MLSESEIRKGKVLIVDDQEANVRLLEGVLLADGYESASSTTRPSEVYPLHLENRYDLILLDLQMPEMDGFEVMDELRKIEPDGYLPVLVITAEPDQKLRALENGAKDFISKPFDLKEVLARVHNMLEVRLLNRQLQRHNEELEQRVRERTIELQESYHEAIIAMMRATEYRDEATGAHVQRISLYCRALARLLGLDQNFVDSIFFASPMHDIGKLGIPDDVLLKPAALTSEEWEIVKGHTVMGGQILGNCQSPYLRMGADIALNHHERWDGTGYPLGKRAESIPLSARIVYACDIYDALRSERPYKGAQSHAEAIHVMTHGDGRTLPEHFDPVILATFEHNHDVFRDIFDRYQG